MGGIKEQPQWLKSPLQGLIVWCVSAIWVGGGGGGFTLDIEDSISHFHLAYSRGTIRVGFHSEVDWVVGARARIGILL